MEAGSGRGRWAHRIHLVSPQSLVLGNQQSRDHGAGDRQGEVYRCPSFISSLTGTKTNSYTNNWKACTCTDTLKTSSSDRQNLTPRSLVSSSCSCSSTSSISTQSKRIHTASHSGVNVIRGISDSTHTTGEASSLGHHTRFPPSNRTPIYTTAKSHTPCQGELVTRLSAASLRTIESRNSTCPRRTRRKKISSSNSFLSDDSDTVSSGYASLLTSSETDEVTTASTTQITCQSHQQSLHPIDGKTARSEYLKAFNEAVRKRNARTTLRAQRFASDQAIQSSSKSGFDGGGSFPKPWRKLRLAVRSAPVLKRRIHMDNSQLDSWEEFEALGMPRDEASSYDSGDRHLCPPPRSMANITSSREYERTLNDMKYSGNINYSKNGALNKSIIAIAGGIRNMNCKSGDQSPRPKTPYNERDVEAVIEGCNGIQEGVDEGCHTEMKTTKKIRSRGWRIVKARLSEIAEKAPKNGIDSTPMTFRNLAQLVKAKEFRMMLKRRASFVENGRFQFEEAKQDLYARYKVDPNLVSKLTGRSRDDCNDEANDGDGAQNNFRDDKRRRAIPTNIGNNVFRF